MALPSTDLNGSSPRSRPSAGLMLFLVLVLVIPPLFVEVHRPAPTRIMEILGFLSSQETWLRMHGGEQDAWKMPTWNGRPRIQKPPLLVWLNLLVWRGLTPDNASVDMLTARARWLAASLAMVCVASVFWLGLTLGGTDLATVSALATGLSLGFIRQARYASYDTHLMAWTALAAASAVWACHTGKTASVRYVSGWVLATVSLAATNLTKGPLGFALVAPAWIAAIALLSPKRLRDTVAMSVAVLLNGAALLLWFAAARRAVPDAAELLRYEYAYIFEISKSPLFYVIVIPLLFPWVLWLAAGIAAPAWRRLPSERREVWFTWIWFVAVFVLLSVSPVKNKRYLAPLFPAAGLLTALAWLAATWPPNDSSAGRVFKRLVAAHWILLASATVLLPLFAAVEPWAVSRGWTRRATFGAEAWVLWAMAPWALVPLVAAGIWAQRHRRYVAAAICTAAWFSATASFGFYAYARTPRHQYAFRDDANTLAQYAKRAPVYYISRFKPPYHEAMPGHELLVYFRGIIPPATLEELRTWATQGKSFFVLTRLDPSDDTRLANAGFQYVCSICDTREPAWKLWSANLPFDLDQSPDP